MKRFSFNRFQASPANRAAFETCRAVAELQPVSPMPVVLVGDSGSGKTHLLYSIVNHVRAFSEKTGLAFVTAREFPEAVLNLLAEPAPLRHAASAILLVDQLDSFSEHLSELESIMRLFLELGHVVIVGTSVHPSRLAHLGAAFQNLLSAGSLISLEPPAPGASRAMREPVAEKTRPKTESEEEALKLRVELAQERERVQLATEQIGTLKERLAAETQKERAFAEKLDAASEKMDALTRQLETERHAKKGIEDQIEQMRAHVREFDEAARRAEAYSETIDKLNRENKRLQAETDQAQAKRASLANERDALREKLAVLPPEPEATRKAELETSGARQAQLEQYIGEMTARIAALVEHVESASAYYVRGEQLQREQADEIESIIEQQAAHVQELEAARIQSEAAMAELARRHGESEQIRRDLEEQLAAARDNERNALKFRDGALDKLDQLTAAHATLEIQLEEARAYIEKQALEMDTLRHEAAVQVATANAQAGEIENKYGRAIETFGSNNQTRQDLVARLNVLRRQLLDSSDAALKVAGQLDGFLPDVPPDGSHVLPEKTEPGAERDEAGDTHASKPGAMDFPMGNEANGSRAIPEIDQALLDNLR